MAHSRSQGFMPVVAVIAFMLAGAVIYLAYRFLAGYGEVGFEAHKPSEVSVLEGGQPGSEQLTVSKSEEAAIVQASDGALRAKFTRGARSVVMHGPSRTFAEPGSTSATVTTSEWVRIYPRAFDGVVDRGWLDQATAQNDRREPDVLATAMQYIRGAPQLREPGGTIVAGDASFGPGLGDGDRQEGSDFNDFMGIQVTYGGSVDRPEADQYGSLDCSGFQRMVWGYRSGLPLELEPTGTAIPRRAYQILSSAPGVTVVADNGRPLSGPPAGLQTGDVLFFNVETDDGPRVDHMAIYLGLDSEGSHRFISSRIVANGPTMGDIAGRSVIDGTGFFAKSFRAVRRF